MRRWEPWGQAGSSSQPGAGSGAGVGAYLEWVPRECRVAAASAAVHRELTRLCGGGLVEEEGGDPSVLGGEGEACLCAEMLPGNGENRHRESSFRLQTILM